MKKMWAVCRCDDRDESVVVLCQSQEQAERLAVGSGTYAAEVPLVVEDPPILWRVNQAFHLDGTERGRRYVSGDLCLNGQPAGLGWQAWVSGENRITGGGVNLHVWGPDRDAVEAKADELVVSVATSPALRDPRTRSWGSEIAA